MQTKKDDPAMPTFDHDNESYKPGLTKREYFAAAALPGLIRLTDDSSYRPSDIASAAVELADLLIIELNKTDAQKD